MGDPVKFPGLDWQLDSIECSAADHRTRTRRHAGHRGGQSESTEIPVRFGAELYR